MDSVGIGSILVTVLFVAFFICVGVLIATKVNSYTKDRDKDRK